MKNDVWNPWHGCKKYSSGCLHCYVYRRDESIGKDASIVTKTSSFYLPLQKDRYGNYKIPPNSKIYCCMTSDFFIDEADKWREEIWDIIKLRSDVNFHIITKRIDRFLDCIPPDWNEGYDNVHICCTMENQQMVDFRLPILLSLPIKHKSIVCEPLVSNIDFQNMLNSTIENVTVGGESGPNARCCHYDWVLNIREQCIHSNIPFYFKQTGANFEKDGKIYQIERKYQQAQANKANINFKY